MPARSWGPASGRSRAGSPPSTGDSSNGEGSAAASALGVAVRPMTDGGAIMNEVARRAVLRSLRPLVEKRLSLSKGTLKLDLADNGHDVVGRVRTDEYRVLVGAELWADLS